MKRSFFLNTLMALAVLLFLVSLILFFWKRETGDWMMNILLFAVPSVLTLITFLLILYNRDQSTFRLILPNLSIFVRVFAIFLSTALGFFQLFMVWGWVVSGTNRNFPAFMHSWCLFMLIGFCCSVAFIFEITTPRRDFNSSTI